MKCVALLMVVDHDKAAASRPAHLDYLGELHRQGKVWGAGRFADGSGGMVIYEVESLEEAQRLAHNDPAVTSGGRTATVYEWIPTEF